MTDSIAALDDAIDLLEQVDGKLHALAEEVHRLRRVRDRWAEECGKAHAATAIAMNERDEARLSKAQDGLDHADERRRWEWREEDYKRAVKEAEDSALLLMRERGDALFKE